MTQTILSGDGIKKQSEYDRLLILRKNYYVQLIRELDILRIRRNQLIMSYRETMKDLDKMISRKRREMNQND